MQVAVLGLGRMGRAVASRLLDTRHDVVVWNRTPGPAGELVSRGAKDAASPEEAAAAADVVLVSLADDGAVRAVVTGEHGAVAGLRADAVLVDMSTVAPSTSREMARATPDGRFVAAPIVGSPQAMAAGKASLLVGGPRQLVDRLDPLLHDLASGYRWCGEDPGQALTVKLLNNYLLLGGLAILAEVVAAAEAAGVEQGTLRSFVEESPLVPPGLHNRLDLVLGDDHEAWFTVRLGGKDVRLLAETAAGAGVELPVARQVEEQFERAAASGWADADVSAIVEVLRGRTRN